MILDRLSPSADKAPSLIHWVLIMLTYSNVVFGSTSLICGVVLVHIHRWDTEVLGASDIVAFLEHAWHDDLGLHPLAIMFSVPWASCLWSLVSAGLRIFALAFASPGISTKIVTFVLPGCIFSLTYSILVLLKQAPNPTSLVCGWTNRLIRVVTIMFAGRANPNNQGEGGWGRRSDYLPV